MNALRFPLAWALTLAGVTSAVQTQSDSRFRFLVLALVAAAVPLSVRNFDHYWLLLLPFAALLSVRPAVELLNRLDAGRVAQNSQVIIMSAFLFLALPVGLHIADTGMSAYGVDGPEGVVTIETQDRIGTQIAEQTNPDDQIVTLGEQHEYYFFADRRPASRNLYYLSVNRDWYSQEGIIRLLGQPNVTYVVIGAPYQEEIARVSQYVQSNQSSYRLVGRYYDSQDEILLYRKESA